MLPVLPTTGVGSYASPGWLAGARYVLHHNCPWNPSRLEQRNGRLDPYGQAREVTVHHFVSDAETRGKRRTLDSRAPEYLVNTLENGGELITDRHRGCQSRRELRAD